MTTTIQHDDGVARCPACGEPIDYCQVHGELGDTLGAYILRQHDEGHHDLCSPVGCPDAPTVEPVCGTNRAIAEVLERAADEIERHGWAPYHERGES